MWNDVRNADHCDEVDEYRMELHDEAVATGQQTAEPEEPRGEESREHGRDQEEDEEGEAPDVQQVCPETFGNSDIFGITIGDPTP